MGIGYRHEESNLPRIIQMPAGCALSSCIVIQPAMAENYSAQDWGPTTKREPMTDAEMLVLRERQRGYWLKGRI